MRLLLANCPECHALMVRTQGRDVCKNCFDQWSQLENSDGSAALSEESTEQASRCKTCGKEIEIGRVFCLRCMLKLIRMTKECVTDLQAKLDRHPALRGRDKPFIEGSRSHVHDVIRSRRRLSRKQMSFTPSTKYSS